MERNRIAHTASEALLSDNKAVLFWRRSISVDMFQKAMDLDLRWHLMRKTGEVTRIMDRGTSAIQQVLSTGTLRYSASCVSINATFLTPQFRCSSYAFSWLSSVRLGSRSEPDQFLLKSRCMVLVQVSRAVLAPQELRVMCACSAVQHCAAAV